MKKKLLSILLVALSVVSLVACGKTEDTVSGNNSEVTEEVVNINYEDSILWNAQYSLNVRNMEIDYFYGKAISPNSNEVLYSSLYSQRCSTSYFNGTDWYVYTDIDPNGEVLEEKVWITGIDNPYEAFELDMYALTRPEVFEEEAYSVNLIDYCVFLKSLGYTEVYCTRNYDENSTGRLYCSFTANREGYGFNIEIYEYASDLEVPEITDCKTVEDFMSVSEQITGTEVNEETIANRELCGYYYADGTFGYEESEEQSWEYYDSNGELTKKYDYDTDELWELIDGVENITPNYYRGETPSEVEEDDDVRYAGELLDACRDLSYGINDGTFSSMGYDLSMDSTFEELYRAEGLLPRDFVLTDEWLLLDGDKIDEEFMTRYREVFETFSIQYIVDNYHSFDRLTQSIILGLSDQNNFTLDGETTFRDMLTMNGVDIYDASLLEEYYLRIRTRG